MTEYQHIVRIGNTDVDGRKSITYALKKIKGVDTMFANAAINLAGIDKDKQAGNLLDTEIEELSEIVQNPVENGMPSWMINRRKDYETGDDKHLLGSNLEFQHQQDIKRLSKTKSYRGLRHQWGLTVRGQKTRSNFRDKRSGSLGVQRSALDLEEGDDEE
jgi:small subunit ribosomal protein S13